MLENLTGFIIHLIETAGYPGILTLMILNASAIPIPSEIILPFAGFLASTGKFTLPIVILIGILGDLIGSVIAYGVGYFLEEAFLLNLIKRYGKFLLITEHDYTKATNWIKKYGSIVVFLGKMSPGIKSFMSVAAGISEIKFIKFVTANILASLIYVTFVSYIGFFLGSRWNQIGIYFRRFELLIAVILIAGLIWYINYKLKIFKFKR